MGRLAPMEKTIEMNQYGKSIVAGLVAVLWAAAGAAPSAAETGTTHRSTAEKQRVEKSRAQKAPEKKPRAGNHAQHPVSNAKAEAVLCDGVPFGPTDTSGAGAGKQ